MTNEEIKLKMRAATEATRFIAEAKRRERKVLLDASDGPEGILIYTSEEQGVCDWSETFPALYVEVSIAGARTHLGPFQLSTILLSLRSQLRQGDEAASGDIDASV
jgi:hypothetical protein